MLNNNHGLWQGVQRLSTITVMGYGRVFRDYSQLQSWAMAGCSETDDLSYSPLALF